MESVRRGGPAVNFFNPDAGDSESDAGINLLVGAKNNAGVFFEIKVGIEGSPDLKFGVGYTFR